MTNSANPGLPGMVRPSPYQYPAPVFTGDDRANEQNLISVYARTLLRHKWLILGFALLGAATGVATTLSSPATYRARTSLDIQSINEDFMNIRAVDPTQRIGGNSVETVMQTEIKLLQSETLLNRVVAMLTSLPAHSATTYAHPSAILSGLHLAPPAPPSRDQLIRDLAAHLTIKPLGLTRMVEISCESQDRDLAVLFCNTVTEQFLLQDQEARWSTARETIDWLSRQMAAVRVKLQDSEQKLQDFKRQNQLLFSADKESVAQMKLRLLQHDAAQAEADLVARKAQYNVGTSASPDSLPAVLDDEPSKQYKMKLAELERLRAEQSQVYTPESPQILKIDAQIATLRTSIEEARGNLVQRLRNEFDSASARQKALESSYKSQEELVSGQVGKTAQLNMLEREAESGREVYTALLQKVKEAGFASALKSNPIRVVDRATPPSTPAGPRRRVHSAIGLLAGLASGILLTFVRARSDRTFRLPGDAGSFLSIRELGVIPSATHFTLNNDIPTGRWGRLLSSGKDRGLAVAGGANSSLELVAWTRKGSLMAEAYRAAMSSILYSNRGGQLRSAVVSSPTMGEGKTTLISNLGIAFAEAGRRVILVDADLRMPRLHTIFDIGNNSGVQQALRGENDPATCAIGLLAHETQVPNLFVLPSGSGSDDASMLLHSPRLPALISRLEKEFDMVLIDSPPMLHLPDARIVARLTKGVMLVLRAGVATRETAASAARSLHSDGTPIVGVFLNDFNPAREAVHGYYKDYRRYRNVAV